MVAEYHELITKKKTIQKALSEMRQVRDASETEGPETSVAEAEEKLSTKRGELKALRVELEKAKVDLQMTRATLESYRTKHPLK